MDQYPRNQLFESTIAMASKKAQRDLSGPASRNHNPYLSCPLHKNCSHSPLEEINRFLNKFIQTFFVTAACECLRDIKFHFGCIYHCAKSQFTMIVTIPHDITALNALT